MVRQAILDGILGQGHGFLYNSFQNKLENGILSV